MKHLKSLGLTFEEDEDGDQVPDDAEGADDPLSDAFDPENDFAKVSVEPSYSSAKICFRTSFDESLHFQISVPIWNR